jgi:hypothetical protein
LKFTVSKTEKGKIVVEVNGLTASSRFNSRTSYNEAAFALGIDALTLRAAVTQASTRGLSETPIEVEVNRDQGPESTPQVYRVRNRLSPETSSYSSFSDALTHPAGDDSVIEWESIDETAAVDFDWHGVPSPEAPQLTAAVYQCRPVPRFAWITKNGGLRLIFQRQGDVSAEVLAVAAVVSIYSRLRPPAVELLTRTRHPRGDYLTFSGSDDIGALKQRLLGTEAPEEAVQEYLAEKGVEKGRRYPHSHCPIDPGHTSAAPDPVFVGDDGIHCHSCEGRTGRGFRSYASLTGTVLDSKLLTCVRSCTHWDHAKYVFDISTVLPSALHRPLYSALLTLAHGREDRRLEHVFRPRDLVRFDGEWGNERGQSRKEVATVTSNLPAVRTPSWDLDGEAHELFASKDNITLDAYGYFPLQRVHGVRLSTRFHSNGRPTILIKHGVSPEYLEPKSRVPDPWSVLSKVYEGLDADLLSFILTARGLVEWGTENVPMFLFEGGSGSGKTGMFHLAASILGDRVTPVKPMKDPERIFQGIYEAVKSGSFVTIDELAKVASAARISQVAYCEFLLNLNPRVTQHILYLGPRSLPGTPLVSITDTNFRYDLLADAQLGRRIYYRELGTENKGWRERATEAGLPSTFALRTDPELRLAADSVISNLIDEHFTGEPGSLETLATHYNVRRLDQHGENGNKALYRRELFREWMKLGRGAGVGKGLAKAIRKGHKAFLASGTQDPISLVWSFLHDEGRPLQWQACNEASWQKVADWPKPLKCSVLPLHPSNADFVQVGFQEKTGDKWEWVFNSTS